MNTTAKNIPKNLYINSLSKKLPENYKYSRLTSDDIWEDTTLLVKNSDYLTKNLANKLLKFGIKKANVDFEEKENAEIPKKTIITDFAKTQYVLIIENNFLNAAWLVRNLIDIGFSKKNIFITANYRAIKDYFKIKRINFIFTNLSFYEKSMRSINRYSLLKSTYAYIFMEENDTARKIKTNYNSGVKFIQNSANSETFNVLINSALSSNFENINTEKSRIS